MSSDLIWRPRAIVTIRESYLTTFNNTISHFVASELVASPPQ
jgi:hypothetical protein